MIYNLFEIWLITAKDKPDPSFLIFGLDINGRFLHVVIGINLEKITKKSKVVINCNFGLFYV